MALLCCQVPRIVDVGGLAVGGPHAAAIRSGFDMVALRQHLPPPVAPDLDLGRIAFYSPGDLRVRGMEETLALRGRGLVDEFGLGANSSRDRRHIGEMIGGYRGAALHAEKFRKLQCLARVHEAINSPPEFARMRGMILGDRLGEYVSSTAAGRRLAAEAVLGGAGTGGAVQTVMPEFFAAEGRSGAAAAA